jgi:hypothetical protein
MSLGMNTGFAAYHGVWTALIGMVLAGAPGLSFARVPGSGPSPSLQVQVADSAALVTRAEALIAAPAVVTPPPELAPAPMPNPDADDPTRPTVASTRISPALISRYKVFEGDGFSRASNADYGLDEKTMPAAGINLSVPVK